MENQAVDHLTLENLIPVTSLESLVKGYILNCQCERKSPKTIAIYEIVLKNFVWYCRKNDYPETPKLTAMHIRHFLLYLATESNRWGNDQRKPANQTTVNDYYRTLRTYFNWLQREELILENPFNRLKPPKIEKKVIQALTPTEIERLFKEVAGKSPIDIRNKAILSVLLDTGLRVSELANLSLDDIDSGSILVRHGKGGKQRMVRIGSRAQKAVWKYVTIYRRSEGRQLFINRSGEPLDVQGIKILIRRMGEKVGVKAHPHKFRHTFAVSFLRAGGDVFSLQYLLGHTTLQMTQRYLQSLDSNDAMNAHRKFSPLDNLGK